jgi:hypothetical protein
MAASFQVGTRVLAQHKSMVYLGVITDTRQAGGCTEYSIKYDGWGSSANEWKRAEDLFDPTADTRSTRRRGSAAAASAPAPDSVQRTGVAGNRSATATAGVRTGGEGVVANAAHARGAKRAAAKAAEGDEDEENEDQGFEEDEDVGDDSASFGEYEKSASASPEKGQAQRKAGRQALSLTKTSGTILGAGAGDEEDGGNGEDSDTPPLQRGAASKRARPSDGPATVTVQHGARAMAAAASGTRTMHHAGAAAATASGSASASATRPLKRARRDDGNAHVEESAVVGTPATLGKPGSGAVATASASRAANALQQLPSARHASMSSASASSSLSSGESVGGGSSASSVWPVDPQLRPPLPDGWVVPTDLEIAVAVQSVWVVSDPIARSSLMSGTCCGGRPWGRYW